MNRIDEHGKVFTERVHKTRIEVRVLTSHGEVHGYIHMTPDQRVKDLLNNGAEQFIAITDASIGLYSSLESRHIDFIALNKQHIISLIPIDEDKVKRQEDEEFYRPL